MKMYLFDEATGIYIGTKEAVVDEFTTKCKGETVYWLEACATWKEPPFEEGYTPTWNGEDWELVPPPTEAEIQKKLTDAVQEFMDKTAQEKNYDNIHTACTYIDSGNEQFDKEGAACRAWRSAVWAKCYEILAQVKNGERAIPTAEELIAELPELEW